MDQHLFPHESAKKGQAEPPGEDDPRTLTEWTPDWEGAGEDAVPARSSGFSAVYLPCGLFVATVVTTLWAGAYHVNVERVSGAWDFLVRHPGRLWDGWPFAATLLGILVTHEFGHFWLSRIHRVPASLPLFIPGPPQLIGTFGAIIRMRSPIMNRRALFDIGVAGPIAGFIVAVAALILGLSYSTVVPRMGLYGLQLGEPLLLQFFAWIIFGPIPDTHGLVLHPVAFAAWFGLFITALNLIPLGQLDGGHVAYALFGRGQRTLSFTLIPTLFALGLWGWPGWILWAGLAGFAGLTHPPVLDPGTELGRGRFWVGWAAVAVFFVSFSPVPFYFG